MTHGDEDLGPLPYGKPDRDYSLVWVTLAIAAVVIAGVFSFVKYDLTNQFSAVRPMLIPGLGIIMCFAFVFFWTNFGKKMRKKYVGASRFRWWMVGLFVLCGLMIALLIIFP